MQTIVINLYGGPCCGKSTVSAGLFYELKCLGVECELTGEYAKDKTWDEHQTVLRNQPYVFGKQLHRIWRLQNKVDIIVCDSPILLSTIYDSDDSDLFELYVLEQYKKYNNINFVLERKFYNEGYQENGRNQTMQEAIEIDNDIENLLDKHNLSYTKICESNSKKMVNKILEILKEKKVI
jgi:hypothetical protein